MRKIDRYVECRKRSYLTRGLLFDEYIKVSLRFWFPKITFYSFPTRLTKRQLLPWVWGQGEVEHRHGGYQEARHDQVVEVVQGSPSQLDNEGYVQIRLRAAVIDDLVSAGGDTCNILMLGKTLTTMTLQQWSQARRSNRREKLFLAQREFRTLMYEWNQHRLPIQCRQS